MMDQAEILGRVVSRIRDGINVHVLEGEVARSLPKFNLGLDLWGPKHIRLLWRRGPFLLDRHIHIRASAVMFRTVSTFDGLDGANQLAHGQHSPLWKVLIAANVTAFTGLTTLSRLCVAMISVSGLSSQPLFSFPRSFWGERGNFTHLLLGGPPPGPAILTES
jgi:hypothetical protein